MNNNTKSRKAVEAKANKGIRRTSVYKKKAKPFPTPKKEVDMSMSTQRDIFYGKNA